LSKDEAWRNFSAVVLLLLTAISIATGLIEISRGQEHILAVAGEKLTLESKAMLDVTQR
jgi:hypothetical protein